MTQVVDESPPVKEVEKNDDNKTGEVSEALDELNLQEVLDEQFTILELPDDCIRHIYPFFDIASRRALRENGRLAEIESQAKYRYGTIEVKMDKYGLVISTGGGEYAIPYADVEKEFELLGKNTYFDEVIYKSTYNYSWTECTRKSWPEIRAGRTKSVDSARILKAKKITFDRKQIDDVNLESLVQNKEEVIIMRRSRVFRLWKYMWLYEIECSIGEQLSFMGKMGEYDYYKREFYTDNPNQQVVNGNDSVTITESCLKIIIERLPPPLYDPEDDSYDWNASDKVSFISFEIIEEEEKGDNT